MTCHESRTCRATTLGMMPAPPSHREMPVMASSAQGRVVTAEAVTRQPQAWCAWS